MGDKNLFQSNGDRDDKTDNFTSEFATEIVHRLDPGHASPVIEKSKDAILPSLQCHNKKKL